MGVGEDGGGQVEGGSVDGSFVVDEEVDAVLRETTSNQRQPTASCIAVTVSLVAMVTVSTWRSLMRTPVMVFVVILLLFLFDQLFLFAFRQRDREGAGGRRVPGRGIPDRREDMPRKPGTAVPGASYGRPDGKVKQTSMYSAATPLR